VAAQTAVSVRLGLGNAPDQRRDRQVSAAGVDERFGPADQFVPLAELSADLQKDSVRARLFVEGLTNKTVAAELTVTLDSKTVTQRVSIKPGLNPYEAHIEIDSPRLWWQSVMAVNTGTPCNLP